jgi:hypothetical protein
VFEFCGQKNKSTSSSCARLKAQLRALYSELSSDRRAAR